MDTDLFSGMLDPGERILALFRAWSPPRVRQEQVLRVWQQVALTRRRLLLVRMVEQPDTGAFAPEVRLGVGREFIRMARHPASATGPACVEIDGCGDRITLVDVEAPETAPALEYFLAVSQGRAGTPPATHPDHEPYFPGAEAPAPPPEPAPPPRVLRLPPLIRPEQAQRVKDPPAVFHPPQSLSAPVQELVPKPLDSPQITPERRPPPRPQAQKSSSNAALWVILGVVLLFVLLCGGCMGLGILGQILQGIA